MTNVFQGKNILVTGGTGSIGSEIVKTVLQHKPEVVRVLSNDENGLFSLEQELKEYTNTRFLVGDIRDKERLRKAVEGIDFIFHAAALKHVPLCEYNPFEAGKTNVLGTQNVIEVAIEEEVEKLITISTDKAVSPTNVMGATKLLAERLTISASFYGGLRRTIFACVRFGNVLDSRGSVVPLFKEQIKGGGPVTITHPDMTRFVMSIPKAINLVLKTAEIAHGGEIFIFKMPALRIHELAEAMIEELAPQYGYDPESIGVEIRGRRAGERIFEELLTNDEAIRASETRDMFIITQVANKQEHNKISFKKYRSDNEAVLLTKDEVKEMLKESLSRSVSS
jgi:UDP-N-acetylglucosamine 4,6-dehydratase